MRGRPSILPVLIPLAAAALFFAGLRLLKPPAPHDLPAAGDAAAPALVLYCDTGLQPSLAGIIELFQRRTGYRVDLRPGSSGELLDELVRRRRGDVFLPDGEMFIAAAEREMLVAESRVIARQAPVILVARDVPRPPATPGDLASPDVRLGALRPGISALGPVTEALLSGRPSPAPDAGEPDRRTASSTPDLALAVARRQADAALVWRHVALPHAHEATLVELPADGPRPALAVAVLTVSAQPELAREFAAFLCGDAAQTLLRKHGLEPPQAGGR